MQTLALRSICPPLISLNIEPATRALLEAIAEKDDPPIQTLPVSDAREALCQTQAIEVPKLPVDYHEQIISDGKKGAIMLTIVRPKGHHGVLPVAMYFHGGGWVLGDADTYDRLIREIAHGAEVAVVFVNFSRSPEAIYPVAIEEAYMATCWMEKHAKAFNLDGSRLAVVGDSMGGNMAAAVTLLAKERDGPKIDFQVLFYPVTDANFETASYRRFAEGHFLTRAAMKWFWNCYLPDVAARSQPTASPLCASLEQLRDLPPALVITAEFDVLRDEGEAYAHKLAEAEVNVTATRYLGTIHDFVMLNSITQTPAPRGAILQANTMLRHIFQGNI